MVAARFEPQRCDGAATSETASGLLDFDSGSNMLTCLR
jgi:hypothetical protein